MCTTQVFYGQNMTSLPVSAFIDSNYPQVEPHYLYDFHPPVLADILTMAPIDYIPSYQDRYFMSIYGPRHKEVSTSNIGYFDFHKGSDITAVVEHNGVSYDASNAPPIYCMCDGVVSEIFDGPDSEMEATGTGRYVTVKCDSSFRADPSWGNIYIAFRHLASVGSDIQLDARVAKGEVIGQMGASGTTSTVHLHLSVIRKNTGSSINVQPMRIFDPQTTPHLLDYLHNAEINQLKVGVDSAVFRLVIPYNQSQIRAIHVQLEGTSYERIYDFEAISIYPEEERDDNDIIPGLELFAYPYNRGHSAYRRVWDRYQENQIPANYPASLDANHENFYPFLSEGLLQSPSYVLDLKVADLPLNYNINDLKIEVIDIFGHGLRSYGTSNTSDQFAWGMVLTEEDDAEEKKQR